MKFYSTILLLSLFMISTGINGQQRLTISGTIHDANSGENLFGASLYIKELGNGTQTNVYGFYSISLVPGTYNLEFRYIGYETVEKKVDLTTDQTINIELKPESQQLQELIIQSTSGKENVSDVVMSVNKLDIKTMQKIPAFLGEVDIIKSILLLPGVTTVGEGASGFNVRGGSVGQNLILLDEAPVYNSSHLLGFFSVFNPDAVKDIKLYKGGIPAQYGGRIASILDIRMKEGNNKHLGINGGIGTIFSRLTVEAPIVKNRSSFILSARRSYADILFRPFVEILQNGAALNFYDITFKTNYDFSDKDKIYLSGYLGRDNFKFDKNQGFSWGNKTGTLRWNHVYSHHLFMNLTSYFSDYDYNLAFGDNNIDRFEWKSRIQTTSLKPDFSAFYGLNNVFNFGGEGIYYHFYPANATGISNGIKTDISLDDKYSVESAIYASNEQNLNDNWSLAYGIRFSNFRYLGPGSVYEYTTIKPGERKLVTGEYQADKLETIKQYSNLEPRASIKFQINSNTSIKAGYNRMAQYIHLISNTTASNPLDVWTPSTNNIKPELADQVALGIFRNFSNNTIEASLEGYYKAVKNQIDYIDGADILINKLLEGELLNGIGRAYGAEMMVQKKSGRWNGWVSYTLGWTEQKVEGINNFKWYPARFDQRHNLKVAVFYDLNPRWSFSANFTFLSGTPTTFPTSRFQVQDYLIPFNGLNSRNNMRIPDYHRLDLSATLNGRKISRKGKVRKNADFWVFSVYNVYARKNPFSIYFSQSADRPVNGQPIQTQATMVSIIGTIVPSISYNFKF
jgi:hypothetical protein